MVKPIENILSSNRSSDIILSETDKAEIEKLFPGFKFKIGLNSDLSFYGFSSKLELINSLNLTKNNFESYFTQNAITIQAITIVTPSATPPDSIISPTVTVTCPNIISGGLFSSFTLTFSYNNTSGISGQALSLIGGTVGWWWNSGYSASTGLNSGYSTGTATYFYGLGTYSSPYTLSYTYNPTAHTLTYHWNSGTPQTQQ